MASDHKGGGQAPHSALADEDFSVRMLRKFAADQTAADTGRHHGWILSKLRKPVGGWTRFLRRVRNAHRQCTRECGCASSCHGATSGRSACVCDASCTGCAGSGCSASIWDEYIGEDLDRAGDCLCSVWRSSCGGIDVRRSSRAPKGDELGLSRSDAEERVSNAEMRGSMAASCCRSQRWALSCTWKLCGPSTGVTMRQDALTA